VLGIHYGVQAHPAPPAAPVAQTTPAPQRHARKRPFRRYAIVQRGDSFSSLAVRAHTTVAALERLNPGASTTALRVGQRIRVH
jgi:LysM repeat protein